VNWVLGERGMVVWLEIQIYCEFLEEQKVLTLAIKLGASLEI
jgi:hypothetical protein